MLFLKRASDEFGAKREELKEQFKRQGLSDKEIEELLEDPESEHVKIREVRDRKRENKELWES